MVEMLKLGDKTIVVNGITIKILRNGDPLVELYYGGELVYPTENVPFALLAMIKKTGGGLLSWSSAVVTKDRFTDKAVFSVVQVQDYPHLIARYVDAKNFYLNLFVPGYTTADHQLRVYVNGRMITIASEAVDIDPNRGQGAIISCSGSTIKSLRWDTGDFLDPLNLPEPTGVIAAVDTNLQAGYFGYRFLREKANHGAVAELTAYLLAPMTPLPSAKVIVEVEVTSSDTGDGSHETNLKQELVEVSKLTNIPKFLKQEAKRYEILKNKGFTDEEIKALLGYVPKHEVDLASVTSELFELKPEHNTVLVAITKGNAYVGDDAILKQIEHAKSKGLITLKPPKDYREAVEQYRQIRRDFPEWIAGKDNYAYLVLGHKELDCFQVADTYYGRIVQMGDTKAYEGVPDWEMRKTLNMWKERLKKVNVLKEEAEKHLKKLEEVEKKGW